MKKQNIFTKLFALTASALILAALPNTGTLTVSAKEPTTYYLMYEGNADDEGRWYYQSGSEWDAEAEHRELNDLQEVLQNGDTVIIGNGAPEQLTLNVHLSNLTIKNTSEVLAMVNVTGGIDSCYFLNNSLGSITGNVSNAYVYGASTANFNNNVTNLYSYNDNPDAGPNIGVLGTVAYYVAEDSNVLNPPHGTNFATNSFGVENGELTTDPSRYTQNASEGPASSNTQNSAPAQPTPKPAAPASSDEYDSVPKTGEAFPEMWLLLAAITCFTASLFLRKTVKQ